MWIAVWLGTVVTGSGPHAGDEHSVRTGFDPALVAHIHAVAVYLTIAATFGAVFVHPQHGVAAAARRRGGAGRDRAQPVSPRVADRARPAAPARAALAIAAATNLFLSVRPATLGRRATGQRAGGRHEGLRAS